MAVALPSLLHTKMASADAIDFRRLLLDSDLQAGVMGAGEYIVAQTGVASMNVTVSGGVAWVKGTNSVRQGLYDLYNDSSVSLNIGANSSGNPRLDQIILRVYDSSDGGNNQDAGAVEVLAGTPTAAATLNNRNGAAALPSSSVLLADILVANGAASITNSVIRDRRPWARGFFAQTGGFTVNGAAGSSVAAPGTTIPEMSITGEFTGVPVQLNYQVTLIHSVANTGVVIVPQWSTPTVAATALPGFGAADDSATLGTSVGTLLGVTLSGTLTFLPPAGRGTVSLSTYGTAAGSITASQKRRVMTLEELVRQAANNAPAGYG